MLNKRSLGTEKEELAASYLEEQGVVILDKNFYFRGGELDIVAKDGEYLCFIEVKYRKSRQFGFPEEAVTTAKQQKIIQGAKLYLYQKRYPVDMPCRFDVISICQDEINWIKDAFSIGGW